MWVQELFTELKKLAPLLRCDVAKLGPKRSFRGICIGNTPIKIDFQNLKKPVTFGQNTQISPFLAKLQTKTSKDWDVIFGISRDIWRLLKILWIFWILCFFVVQFYGLFLELYSMELWASWSIWDLLQGILRIDWDGWKFSGFLEILVFFRLK